MFTERVKSSFATNEPIYTEEIIGLMNEAMSVVSVFVSD